MTNHFIAHNISVARAGRESKSGASLWIYILVPIETAAKPLTQFKCLVPEAALKILKKFCILFCVLPFYKIRISRVSVK